MRIPVELTYDMVAERHPQELINLITKLRNSSSKMKDSDPEHMTFEYNYAMSCGVSYNGKEFMDMMIAGTLPKHERPDTVEGKVADWMERATPVCLTGKIGRWNASERVKETPPELEESFRRDAEREVAEEQRRASMTDEEREQETQDILKNLSGMGGFVGFRIG